MSNKPERIIFEEVQSFRDTWIWTLLLVSSIMPLIIVLAVGLSDPGMRKDLWWIMLLVGGIEALNLWIFGVVKFETYITEDGVYYRWSPFFRKYSYLPASSIKESNYRKWTAMKWGFTIKPGWGRCHTVNGKDGFQFQLADGRKFYIGTQQQQAFQHALQRIVHQKQDHLGR